MYRHYEYALNCVQNMAYKSDITKLLGWNKEFMYCAIQTTYYDFRWHCLMWRLS